ncbi:MAG TPA: choice-of-anchor D domain-containing protein [Candidatus Binataceae bacterium]|nr:choice-of-anchor D domain-containing protein [Candidatus Binataceae bacterium]
MTVAKGGGCRFARYRSFLMVLTAAAMLFAATARAGSPVASRVLGQPNLTDNAPNLSLGSGLYAPQGIAFGIVATFNPNGTVKDSVNVGYVADTLNNRVLGWVLSASPSGRPADIVLGQPDFASTGCNDGISAADKNGLGADSLCGPTGVTVDSKGNLYVADSGNNRVLFYYSPSIVCPGTTTAPGGASPSPFKAPCIHPGASFVFGQGGSYSTTNCGSAAPNAGTLCNPVSIALDSVGNVFIADAGENRVLGYGGLSSASRFNDPNPASIVFGQGSLDGASCQPPSASSLCNPNGVWLDPDDNLYISDTANNRVLEYNAPLDAKSTESHAGDNVADNVFGQVNFTSRSGCAAPSATSLCNPVGVTTDSTFDVFVADSGNNRMLGFQSPFGLPTPTPTPSATPTFPIMTPPPFTPTPSVTPTPGDSNFSANNVFGQASDATNVCGNSGGGANTVTTSATTLCRPSGVGVDTFGNVWVVDGGVGGPFHIGNNRAFSYMNPYANPTPTAAGTPPGNTGGGTTGNNGPPTAQEIIGQKSNSQTAPNIAKLSGLQFPRGVVLDSLGHVFVVDSYNSRLLGWASASAFANGADADLVIGQKDGVTTGCDNSRLGSDVNGVGPDTLCNPTHAAADSAGNLYVADTGNNRVIEYLAPFTNCLNKNPCVEDEQGHNAVFGQATFTGAACGDGRSGDPAPSPTTLCAPTGLAFDSFGDLYVADTGASRVIEYNPPFTAPNTATSVFGQADLNSAVCGDGRSGDPAPSAATLCNPIGVAVDNGGNVYIADGALPGSGGGNARVLEYNAGDLSADMVFGQPDFATNVCTAPSATSLCYPQGLAVDANGDLFVADAGYTMVNGAVQFGNNRVLEYVTPTNPFSGVNGAGDTVPDVVFGQNGSFSTNFCDNALYSSSAGQRTSASGLCDPEGLATDAAGNLYVSDTLDNRMVEFAYPFITTVLPRTSIVLKVAKSMKFKSEVVGAFGQGATSPDVKVTITNPRAARHHAGTPLQFLTPIVTAAGSPFQVDQSATTCGANGASLPPGAHCVIALNFTPNGLGPLNGSLKIVDSAKNSPQFVSLHGTGIMATVTVSPKSLNFGNVPVGQAPTRMVTVSSNTQVPLNLTTLIEPSGPFTIDPGSSCVSPIQTPCEIVVDFQPTRAGKIGATLSLTRYSKAIRVPVSGVGQ